jgi:hypothetical protein
MEFVKAARLASVVVLLQPVRPVLHEDVVHRDQGLAKRPDGFGVFRVGILVV